MPGNFQRNKEVKRIEVWEDSNMKEAKRDPNQNTQQMGLETARITQICKHDSSGGSLSEYHRLLKTAKSSLMFQR